MSSLAVALKEEIARIARKEVRSETDALKKTSARYRGEIADLKRRVSSMERQIALLQKAASHTGMSSLAMEQKNGSVRFSPAGLKKLRERHNISAAVLGGILGVSLQTIFNWEAGKTRPVSEQVAKIAILRKIGKREFRQRLEMMG